MGIPGRKPGWSEEASRAAVRGGPSGAVGHSLLSWTPSTAMIWTTGRMGNLRLLCPNCYSQTATYRGRNIGTKPWRVREGPGWRNRYTRGT
jgi:hypothetical protein